MAVVQWNPCHRPFVTFCNICNDARDEKIWEEMKRYDLQWTFLSYAQWQWPAVMLTFCFCHSFHRKHPNWVSQNCLPIFPSFSFVQFVQCRMARQETMCCACAWTSQSQPIHLIICGWHLENPKAQWGTAARREAEPWGRATKNSTLIHLWWNSLRRCENCQVQDGVPSCSVYFFVVVTAVDQRPAMRWRLFGVLVCCFQGPVLRQGAQLSVDHSQQRLQQVSHGQLLSWRRKCVYSWLFSIFFHQLQSLHAFWLEINEQIWQMISNEEIFLALFSCQLDLRPDYSCWSFLFAALLTTVYNASGGEGKKGTGNRF